MHSFFFTPPVHTAVMPAPAPACMMQMTVDADAVTALRRLVMRVCGDALQFMRIEACAHGSRMKVWLCLGKQMVALVMDAVMRARPGAEFGACCGIAGRAPAARRAS